MSRETPDADHPRPRQDQNISGNPCYNKTNEVVGVDMLYLSKRSAKLNLSALEFETG